MGMLYDMCVHACIYHLCPLTLSQGASVTKQIIPVMSGKQPASSSAGISASKNEENDICFNSKI